MRLEIGSITAGQSYALIGLFVVQIDAAILVQILPGYQG